MGTFSIGHFLVLLLVLFIFLTPFFFARQKRKLSRKPLAWRYAAVLAVAVIMAVVGEVLKDMAAQPDPAKGLILAITLATSVIQIVFGFLTLIWSIYRTQDIGWSRWMNLVLVVPLVNLAWMTVLLFNPGKTQPAEQASLPEPDQQNA
jgi:hypothetical protein